MLLKSLSYSTHLLTCLAIKVTLLQHTLHLIATNDFNPDDHCPEVLLLDAHHLADISHQVHHLVASATIHLEIIVPLVPSVLSRVGKSASL